MKTTYTSAEAKAALHINAKTFLQWLQEDNIQPQRSKRDHRIKLFTREQIEYLAKEHERLLIPESSVASIVARKDAAGAETLIARIEALESQYSAILDRLREIETTLKEKPAIPVTAAPAVPTKPPALRPTRLVQNGNGDILPADLISFRAMAKTHNIAESTVQRAIESGRLPVQRGRWKQGRAWVEMALDAAGQSRFYELFVRNPGFKPCAECPHGV